MAFTRFLRESGGHAHIRPIELLPLDSVPAAPGVYIFSARPGHRFAYPRGRSPVFYIGRSTNLRRRLTTHRRFILQAREDRHLQQYWPRYEYGASFGCRVTVIVTRRGDTAATLESQLLSLFAAQYGVWPVANGVGVWQ
jgi:excinuclease UvrABC nuclease subunit